MPIYTYESESEQPCQKCSGQFEVQQGIKDPALLTCGSCGQACHRIITSVQITGRRGFSLKKAKSQGFKIWRKKGKGCYVRD